MTSAFWYFVRVWFFDQSEFEKKSNSIIRLFRHWKQLTSEHWLRWNDFLIKQIVLSLAKRSTILNFCSLSIILMEFSFFFVPLGFVFQVKDKSVALFIPNEIGFDADLTSQCEFPVGAICSFFITVRKTKKRLIITTFRWIALAGLGLIWA